jgi:hypothetical protein
MKWRSPLVTDIAPDEAIQNHIRNPKSAWRAGSMFLTKDGAIKNDTSILMRAR